jgi:hypothetical protein
VLVDWVILVARWTRAGQQNFVDHVDHAVVCLDVSDDHCRHLACAICDCHAAVCGGDAQTFTVIDWLEVVGTMGEIGGHAHAIIYVVQQNVCQLAFVFFQKQSLNRAGWQCGECIVQRRVDGEIVRACKRVREAGCGDSSNKCCEAFIASGNFGNGLRGYSGACNGERGSNSECFQVGHFNIPLSLFWL